MPGNTERLPFAMSVIFGHCGCADRIAGLFAVWPGQPAALGVPARAGELVAEVR
jgi:hypothetical protein